MSGTSRGTILQPTTKTAGDLPSGAAKAASKARGTRVDKSGSNTPPKR